MKVAAASIDCYGEDVFNAEMMKKYLPKSVAQKLFATLKENHPLDPSIAAWRELHLPQSPKASYGLYSDYFWYEIGDVICIGDRKCLYYCFPKGAGDVVAKTRQAAEEMYKISRERT